MARNRRRENAVKMFKLFLCASYDIRNAVLFSSSFVCLRLDMNFIKISMSGMNLCRTSDK